VLIDRNMVGKNDLVKILGRGTVSAALEVHAHAFSSSAKEPIEKAGGSIQIIN
jgi:large subunit ribosomal protein L15